MRLDIFEISIAPRESHASETIPTITVF